MLRTFCSAVVKTCHILETLNNCHLLQLQRINFRTAQSEKCTVKDWLIKPLAETVRSDNKITVIGAGNVGMAIAICCLTQNVTNEICLIDSDTEKATGEMMDLQQGASLLNNASITSGNDYCITANSRLCIITAGANTKKGETRLSLIGRNADILQKIVEELIKYSPNTILLLVNNPVDIMTYLAWKLSGLPHNHVIGSGTSLDSSRFRTFMSQRLGVGPGSCHAYVIGEHGDSSVVVWSSVNVAGVRLRDFNETIGMCGDPEKWNALNQAVTKAAYKVISKKGYTSWAIALCSTAIARAILTNSKSVMCVSVLAKGCHGIEKDIFLSLPCILGANGVEGIIKLPLTEYEKEKLKESADILGKGIDKLKI